MSSKIEKIIHTHFILENEQPSACAERIRGELITAIGEACEDRPENDFEHGINTGVKEAMENVSKLFEEESD